MSPPPRVSVLMPVHNTARYVSGAIASILAQTLTDWELILVDDGSTDGSTDILRARAAADPRLVVITTAHGGVAAALNRGLAAARAPLVARMDADDEALPQRLERQVAVLAEHPATAVLGSGMDFIDADGRATGQFSRADGPDQIRNALLAGNCLGHPTVMLRRDAALAVGGYRTAFRAAEDYDLWLRLSERHDLRGIPDVLLRYRAHADNATARHWDVMLLEVLAAQHAARLRRAGRADPLSGFTRIDAATLRAIGVPRPAIAAALGGECVSTPPLSPRGWQQASAAFFKQSSKKLLSVLPWS